MKVAVPPAADRLMNSMLPSTAELMARARELASRVVAARNAPIGEEFTGPVLLEGTGSSQFIAETPTRSVGVNCAIAPASIPNPPALKSSTVC